MVVNSIGGAKIRSLFSNLLIIGLILVANVQAAKEYTEEIAASPHTYQVKMNGTLDEFNTADYFETYLASMRLLSRFQPNEYLVIENIGDKDVVNPRIVINGRRNRFSVDDIIADIIKPGMTDQEKALAVWAYVADIGLQTHENDRRVDNGSILINHELTNPVKLSNVYYCSGCQFASANIAILCKYIGLKAHTSGMGSAHRIAEVWYDNDWHVLDGDQRTFYLEKDNKTLASYDDIAKDPNIADRNHDGGFASRGIKSRGDQYKNLERKDIDVNDIKPYLSTMAMTLRPGEKFVWRWDNIGKYRCGDNDRNIKPNRPQGIMPYQLANGKMIYQPRLAAGSYGASESVNIKPDMKDGNLLLQPETAKKSAYVVYKITSHYPVVGGQLSAKFSRPNPADVCRVLVSVRDSNWTEAWSVKNADGGIDKKFSVPIDKVLNPIPTPAIYSYLVKFELQSSKSPKDVSVSDISIESDVQMSATSLPSLSAGLNNVAYKDDSKDGRHVRITHCWNESSIILPPLPPAAATKPTSGSRLDLASPQKRLRWEPAKDPDGFIADYHIQVSTRPDMLYPVSPVFDRIIFSQEPEWKVPDGWLLKGQTYYWRVRAKDNWGVWSDWSKVWTFTAAEPAPKPPKPKDTAKPADADSDKAPQQKP
jgi:hypothetical protein